MFKIFGKKNKPAKKTDKNTEQDNSNQSSEKKSPYTKEEEESIKKRLRDLGYIE